MLSLDKNTLKIITGRMQIRQGAPTKDDNMEVISAIVKITITGSAGHECRRFEIIWTVKTLDQLTVGLCSKGLDISCSSVYDLFLEMSVQLKGKGMQIPLLWSFFAQKIQHLEKGAGFLDLAEVIFHSQDNKAKVLIGLTAANRRAPLVMHVEYKVKLPNHDFITAMQNKLVPLIIGDMQVSLQMLRHIQNQFI